MLQWGRTFSSADKPGRPAAAAAKILLQWGRTFSSADNATKLVATKLVATLQWGRTFSSADNWGNFPDGTIRPVASMGPHFFKCG